MEFSKELIQRLKNANHVAVLTGAGVSAESGVATFRDPDGLWAKFNPMELASVDGFMSNPNLVWEWYMYRVDVVNNVIPNPGHKAIAKMEKLFKKFTLITQNVDRLHQRAGSSKAVELHGNIVTNRCFDCSTQFEDEIDTSSKELPKCKECGGKIRPNVVWFGEMLPTEAIKEAESAAYSCDVFFSVGTSAEVYPAANLPHLAKQFGAYVIEVNPNKTPLTSYVDIHLEGPSGEVLPKLLENLVQSA